MKKVRNLAENAETSMKGQILTAWDAGDIQRENDWRLVLAGFHALKMALEGDDRGIIALTEGKIPCPHCGGEGQLL